MQEAVLCRSGTGAPTLNTKPLVACLAAARGQVFITSIFCYRAFFFGAGFTAAFFLGAMIDLLSLCSAKGLLLCDLARLNWTRCTLQARLTSHPLRRPRLSFGHHQVEHRAADSLLDANRDALADAAAVEQDLLSLLALHAALEHEIVGTIDTVLSKQFCSVHILIIKIRRFPVKRNVARSLFLRIVQDFT